MTTFTFIMPCYNAEKNIKQGIESLLLINYPKNKFSIIIIDDCSTDQTVSMVKKCKSEKVSLIQLRKNRGPANARNIGKSKALTDYVIFIDTETIVDKNILLHYSAAAKKFPTAVFSGNIKYFGNKNLNTEIIERGGVFSMRAGIYSKLLWAATNNLCVPKKIYQNYSFNPSFTAAAAEDIDFCFRIRDKGYRILFNSKAVAYHKSFDSFKIAISRTFRYGKGTSKLIKTNPEKSIFSWDLLGRLMLIISFIIMFFLAFKQNNGKYLFWPLFHFMFSSYYLFSDCYTDKRVYEKGLLFSILTSIYKAFMIWIYQFGVIIGNIKNKNSLFANMDPKHMFEGGNSGLALIWFIDDIIIAFFFFSLII